MPSGGALHVDGVNVAKRRYFSGFGEGGKAVFGGLRTFCNGLYQGVPSIAAWAFAEPLGCSAAALCANVNCFFFSHSAYGKAFNCTK
jgi:hypothetical protein